MLGALLLCWRMNPSFMNATLLNPILLTLTKLPAMRYGMGRRWACILFVCLVFELGLIAINTELRSRLQPASLITQMMESEDMDKVAGLISVSSRGEERKKKRREKGDEKYEVDWPNPKSRKPEKSSWGDEGVRNKPPTKGIHKDQNGPHRTNANAVQLGFRFQEVTSWGVHSPDTYKKSYNKA